MNFETSEFDLQFGKGCPWNDLYCVGWDVKPYSLTHSSW